MRVAEISVHSCPLRPPGRGDVGGMNLTVLNLSREMSKMGIEVDIFARRHDADEREITRLDARTRLIHIPAGEPRDIPKMDVFDCLEEFQANLLAFLNKDGAEYDLLHSHYWTSALASERVKQLLGIPNIVSFHTLGHVKNRALEAREEPELRIRSEKEIVAAADCIIASTPEERDDLVRLYGGQSEKVRVVPGGVDLSSFRPEDKTKARRELHLEDCGRVLLFAGRLQPIKGLDILLRALTYLPNGRSTHLLVIGGSDGEADEMAKLDSLAGELGISNKITFVGAVDHERMPAFYNAADICVIPSYHESFGLVAVEALASGTPVIASRVGGLATIVRDGETGYLVDERSPEALAMYLCLLMSENEIRESMARVARQSVMEYDWPLTARRLLRVYRELSRRRPERRLLETKEGY